MASQPRIVIADRSELAANLYQLLLAPFCANLVVRKRFEEARPHFFRKEGVDLGIFNSNVFGKKFAEIAGHFRDDIPLARAKKIFICKENHFETEWREELEKISNSTVVTRPFHPDEFATLVRRLIAGGG